MLCAMTVMTKPNLNAWTADDSTFGARLALIRQRKGWGNVKQAANACRIPVESWRTWERDGVIPQGRRYFDICAQIADVTGCDYGWLVDRRPSGSSVKTGWRGRRIRRPAIIPGVALEDAPIRRAA